VLRGFLILFVYLFISAYAFRMPFLFALAYIWTDLFRPQGIAQAIVSGLPLSMIFGVAAIIAWFFCKEKPKRITFGTGMLIAWAIWMTICTYNAVLPDAAWDKWNWAFKSAVFAVLLPYYFNTREQIESALLLVLIPIAANIIPVALKTIIGGGGYGIDMALTGNGLTESSTLAMVSASVVPLFLWVNSYSLLVSPTWLRRVLAWFLIGFSLVASLGTFARTGLISVGLLLVIGFFRARRKFVYVLVVIFLLSSVRGFMGETWTERMGTIQTAGSDESAMGRVAAWLWTLDYVKEHPLGGGFNVYFINSFSLPMSDGTILEVKGKAFHSIYFEVLGELGYPGLVMFLSMIGWSLLSLRKVSRFAKRHAELAWLRDISTGLFCSTLVYLAGGTFVGVAFQPYFWYLFGIGISLKHYADRLQAQPEYATKKLAQ
jgi:probable O-glycosylation ligase (exosortase A-associated)